MTAASQVKSEDQDRAANPATDNRPGQLIRLKRTAVIAAALLAAWFAIILGLHFGQIHHDRLNYQIAQAFPADKPFVPGEIYATTLAAIMDHELHGGFGLRPNDFFLGGPAVMAGNNSKRQ